MAFHIAAQRARGPSHRKTHKPCQDACRAARAPLIHSENEKGDRPAELIIGAVADGGGSRDLSHVGARLTVSLAVASMTSAWDAHSLQAASAEQLASYWRALCEDCRRILRLEAETRGIVGKDGLGDAGPFACTLVAFMATRERLVAAQVGDGFLVIGRSAGEAEGQREYALAFQNRETEEAGQVVWLTASNWSDDLRTGVFDGPIEFVVASSDGMEKAVLQPDVDVPSRLQPHGRYFEQLVAGCRDTVGEAETAGDDTRIALDQYLAKVLSSPHLDDRTDDDKSMALAVWCGQTGAT